MIETLMAWIPSLLISLIAVLAFLYLAYSSRSQIDKLQRTLQQNAAELVADFLQRESRITRHRLQAQVANNPSDPTRWLAHIRRCWLDAEFAALVEGGQRPSDYALLQSAAMPLLRLTQPKEKNPAVAQLWSSAESREYLQKTRSALASQKSLIQDFKTRNAASLRQPVTGDTQAQQFSADNSGFISTLGNVQNNTTTLLDTIDKLEHELAVAQTKYDVVHKKLAAIEASRSADPAALAIGRVTISKDLNRTVNEQNSDLLNEMESAYSNSIGEMKKMGDINRQQRQLILQLDKELALLRKDTSEYQVSSEVLGKLKLQLRDYENCTTILEMESETLREQIQNLRRTIADSDPSSPINSIDSSESLTAYTVAEEQPEIAEADLLRLIEDISSSDSLERAGAQLVAWLTRQDIASVVYIKGSHEQIWVSSEGRVDDHSKQLLKSMMPITGQPITEVREGVMFIYSACRVLLYGKGDFHEKNGKAQLRLRDIFAATDHILKLFQERLELKDRARQALSIQKKMQSLIVQKNYLDTEHLRTGANFRKEISEYLLTADATEVQKNYIATMLEDFDSQLDILSKTGKLIASGLKNAAHDLEKMADANTN